MRMTNLKLELRNIGKHHCTSLVRESLYKYKCLCKCLWDVEGKDQGSNLQERISHTYVLSLG